MEITVESLRKGFPGVIKEIEDAAVKALSESYKVELADIQKKLDTVSASEAELKKKVDAHEAEKARLSAYEGVITLIKTKAAELKVPTDQLTESRLGRAVPYLLTLEEAKRGDEVIAIVSEWSTPVPNPRPFGPRASNSPANPTDPTKPHMAVEGYVPADADNDTILASLRN